MKTPCNNCIIYPICLSRYKQSETYHRTELIKKLMVECKLFREHMQLKLDVRMGKPSAFANFSLDIMGSVCVVLLETPFQKNVRLSFVVVDPEGYE